MATQVQCPSCGQTYDLTPEQVPQYAGQTINCTRCQKPFTVPVNLAGAVPPIPPPPAYPNMVPAYAQGQRQYTMAAGATQTNGFAIASLICGILGCTGIGAILAIVFGILGIQKTKDPRYGGKGLAIAGLVLGIVMLPCTISTLPAAIRGGREGANRVRGAENMRQIGQSMLL